MAAPFNNAQNDNFFNNGPQMGLTANARNRLAAEGLVRVEDFEDFKEEQLEDAIKNLRIAIPGVAAVLDAAGNVVAPAIPPVLPCLISARCHLRLKVASIAFHYYRSIGRAPSPQNMNYTGTLRGFYTEWEAINKLKDEDRPDVPVLSKNVTPLKWLESFKDCLSRTYGVRSCPVSYVIRPEVIVPAEALDPLIPGQAFGASGSVLEELIARLNHTDPLFRTDNSLVYSLLDEATRNTIYAPTIKPYSRTKNGRAAWEAIIVSHVGDDKWDKIRKDKLNFIMNNKWNGRQYSLEKFTGLHRSAFVMLEEASLHVNFQLPTAHSRVGYLLDNITCQDADLRAALASIRVNTNNMRNDFDAAVAFLLPVCPYAKYKSNQRKNNPQAEIFDVTLKGKGKTGVEFRWYKPDEYSKLTKAQKRELYEWQQSKDGKRAKQAHLDAKKGKDVKKLTKKQLLAKVHSLEKQVKGKDDESSDSDGDEAIPSISELTALIEAAHKDQAKKDAPKVPAKRNDSDPYTAAAVSIQQIIKRKRN